MDLQHSEIFYTFVQCTLDHNNWISLGIMSFLDEKKKHCNEAMVYYAVLLKQIDMTTIIGGSHMICTTKGTTT